MEDTDTVHTDTVQPHTDTVAGHTDTVGNIEGVSIGTTIVLMENMGAGFPITCKNCGEQAVMRSPKAEFCSEDCRFEHHGNRKPKRQEASGMLF